MIFFLVPDFFFLMTMSSVIYPRNSHIRNLIIQNLENFIIN